MQTLSRGRTGATDIFTVLLVVAIVALAGLAYVVLTLPGSPRGSRGILYLQDGDVASIDYVAYLDTGEVFGTSIRSVGENDVAYPKSVIFEPPSFYGPVNMTMAGGVYGPSFEGLADDGKRLQEQFRGMAMGETRTIALDPEDAFGSRDPALVETRTLVETVPLKETITAGEYNERFLQQPVQDQTVIEPFWGWPLRVVDYDEGSGMVTYRFEPEAGQRLTPYENFETLVEDVDASANGGAGEVRVRHMLVEADGGKTFAGGLRGGFLVVDVDESSGTFTVDFNDYRSGRVITYVVTLLDVQRA